MTKDEYLITDPPLKALTVFAMPMILGSFFQQVYNMLIQLSSVNLSAPLPLRPSGLVPHLQMFLFASHSVQALAQVCW